MKIVKFDPILLRDAERVLEHAPYPVREEIFSLLDVFSKNTYIAYSLGFPVGIACSDIFDGRKRAKFAVFVQPKYRRRGIGKDLFLSVLEQAKQAGMKSLVCDFPSDSDNVFFVSSLGFEKRYSSHFMTISVTSRRSVSGFEQYDDSMFLSFVNAEAKAFYPIRSRLGIEPVVIEPNENIRSFLSKAADKYFVYRENGEVLAGGGVYNAEITDIFVAPKLRGQGVGRKIVERCLFEAYKLGYKTVSLWVIAENIPAVSLYSSVGFTIERTHDFFVLQI